MRSEASLRQEQNFNHLLLNNTSALIVAMDLDGKTLMMNKALLNALEYTEEEVRGTDYLAIFVPEATGKWSPPCSARSFMKDSHGQ